MFGRTESRDKALWIVANRAMQAYAENDAGFGTSGSWRFTTTTRSRPASKFRVIMVGLPTALYYCDLFVHRLGATTADRGVSCCSVDGQVMTAFGIFTRGLPPVQNAIPARDVRDPVEQPLPPPGKALHAPADLGGNEEAPVRHPEALAARAGRHPDGPQSRSTRRANPIAVRSENPFTKIAHFLPAMTNIRETPANHGCGRDTGFRVHGGLS